MMKILIAHNWAIVRAGIRQILWDEFGPLEVMQAPAAPEDFDFAAGPWDISFVGVDDPDRKGLHFLTALSCAYPRHPVFALSSRAKASQFERTLKSFIQGSIAIDSSQSEIARAVRRTIAGSATGVSSKTPELSARELEVLRLVAAGKSLKQVAAALKVSESTVSTYRVRLLRKLQLHTTGELIRYAITNRLAD